MNELHLARHLDRAVEGDAHVAHGDGHGVAVDHHQAPLGVHDESGAVVVLLGHAGNRVRHVERDHDQGGGQPVDALVAGLREFRGGRRHARWRRPRADLDAGPDPERVVALAFARRKPAPVHAHHLELLGTGILERHIADGSARAVGEAGKSRLEFRQRVNRLAVEGAEQRAARNARAAEHIAGIGDVDALDGHVVVACLLVGEDVHDGLAELDVLVGGDRTQRLHLQRMLQRRAAPLHLDLDARSHMAVQHVLEREELRNGLAVDRHQDVAGSQHAVRRRTRLHLFRHQHARELRVGAAHPGFGVGIESEPPQFIVRRVSEYGLQGSARHRFAGIDVLQRPDHGRQRKIEARGGSRGAPGVERDHAAVDVDHGRARRAAGRARGCLIIERVEVVVLAVAVLRSFPVQARQRAGENGQLLARIVAHHADLASDDGPGGIQRQLRRLDEAQLGGVVAIDAEIVHRVAVDRIELDLLAILEYRLCGDRTGRDHVSIRED